MKPFFNNLPDGTAIPMALLELSWVCRVEMHARIGAAAAAAAAASLIHPV